MPLSTLTFTSDEPAYIREDPGLACLSSQLNRITEQIQCLGNFKKRPADVEGQQKRESAFNWNSLDAIQLKRWINWHWAPRRRCDDSDKILVSMGQAVTAISCWLQCGGLNGSIILRSCRCGERQLSQPTDRRTPPSLSLDPISTHGTISSSQHTLRNSNNNHVEWN